MQFIYDPKKAKAAFVITLILSIVFFLASTVLGYFYYQSRNLDQWKENIVKNKDQEISQLEEKIDALEGEKESLSSEGSKTKEELEAENTGLNSQISSYKSKIAKAQTYSNFFKYMNSVIETHHGFSDWTDAEFQTALGLAQATGDSSFTSTVNWAWYETGVDPVDRLVRVWRETQTGIENALK